MVVYTIGHSTRSLAELIDLLRQARIHALADIRAFPSSARNPQFEKNVLAAALREAGLTYRWLGSALGGYRKRADPDSPHTALKSQGFRNYADHMGTEAFRLGVAELLALAETTRVAIMCAERLWWRCHRSLVSDYLVACCGVEVVHIVGSGQTEPHRLHRAARTSAGRLVYDVPAPPAGRRGAAQ